MRLTLAQLQDDLKRQLAPVYLLSGDEPLQLGEAGDLIRQAAKGAGFTEREILTVDARFEWGMLTEAASSLSLFAEKKIIDLRIADGKMGNEGSKALQNYCERLPQDILLLISTGKLAAPALKSKWFMAVDKVGIALQVWPLEDKALLTWIQQRAVKRGLQLKPDAIKILVAKVEGNLLAAVQEIEKLYVLFGHQPISAQDIAEVVADSARYDVFKLVEAMLTAKSSRMVKILHSLKAEGIAASVVLWALTREIRLLLSIHKQLAQKVPKEQVFKNHQLWEKRKLMINHSLSAFSQQNLFHMLSLSAEADRQVKGELRGDPWETMLTICLWAHVRFP